MGFLNKYPYTDFHELNLDWFLEEFKKVTDKVTTLDETVQQFTEFVTNYFDNLDVQQEVNLKLDAMAADGTLRAIIQPMFDEYKGDIDAEVLQQDGRIAVLEARMDTFASLPPGSTAGNAEILDIRDDVIGHTWPSAGDAVRGQVNHLDVRTRDVIVPIKNLFDKSGEYTYIKDGYYRNYSTGNENALASYSYTIIQVQPGETYAFNAINMHLCWFADANLTSFISGNLTPSGPITYSNFTAPAGAYWLTVSYNKGNQESTLMIAHSAEEEHYQPFELMVPASKLYGLPVSNLMVVGTGEAYTTIQSAIDAASDGSIIVVKPGIYNEALDFKSSGNFIHMIGYGCDETIVRTNGGSYATPAAEIGIGLIENMAFEVTATTKDPGATHFGYALHIDWNIESNRSLKFINCSFKSANNEQATVGIGLRENYTLSFVNCSFKSNSICVYCHEKQANNSIGQQIELIDCTLDSSNASAPIIKLQETRAYTGNYMNFLAQRVITKRLSGQSLITMVEYPDAATPAGPNWLNSYSWHKDRMSLLNADSVLNS